MHSISSSIQSKSQLHLFTSLHRVIAYNCPALMYLKSTSRKKQTHIPCLVGGINPYTGQKITKHIQISLKQAPNGKSKHIQISYNIVHMSRMFIIKKHVQIQTVVLWQIQVVETQSESITTFLLIKYRKENMLTLKQR